ncbi:PIG-L family deacetylase [Bordetella petrii]|uniref:PIG-L family deacetylase n=1 Tax=Bordetella petrii TaxID=94624 RepID=UPI001E6385C7|nr:PIG-L family deacetylase [Bordetella petrii]MCD0504659.1 PIG-L family deacetylase [Bordetella petrii]
MFSLAARVVRATRLALPWLLWFALAGANAAPPTAIVSFDAPASLPLANCRGIKDLAFVAHLDDDLLFMNPDIASNIEAGGCVQVVYLTASDAGEGEPYMLGRERGVRAAYAYMARQPDLWKEDTVQVNGYHIARFTLQGNPHIQLWHMRVQDPWLGKGWGSLTPLSQAESVAGMTADTLGPYQDTYTRADLVHTLAAIISAYGPTTVRHLDDTISVPYTKLCWRCAGHGHPDHIASARLVREAIALAPGNYAETGYVDYPSQEREANLADAEIASKSEIFRQYAWNDYHYCKGPTGCQEPAGPAAAWVRRAYFVSRHDIAPELFADPQGGLMVFATGEANDAVNMWDNRNRRWNTLGGRTAGPLVSFAYPDSTVGLFARDTLGGLWINKQNPDGTWKGWQAMAGVRVARPPAVAPRGEAAAVAMGNDGLYHWTALQGIDSTWAPWQALPALPHAMGNAAIAKDASDRFWVFAIDKAGQLHATSQVSAQDRSAWQPWQPVPAPPAAGGLAAIRNAQGLIELYLRNRDTRHLMRIVQDATATPGMVPTPAMRWRSAADMGMEYVGKPAIGADKNGEVAVSVLERLGGPLWLVENGQASKLEAHAASLPAMRFLHGTLYIVARGAGQLQSYQVLARNNGVWATAAAIGDLPLNGGGPFATAAKNASVLAVSGVKPLVPPAGP